MGFDCATEPQLLRWPEIHAAATKAQTVCSPYAPAVGCFWERVRHLQRRPPQEVLGAGRPLFSERFFAIVSGPSRPLNDDAISQGCCTEPRHCTRAGYWPV